MLYEYISSNYKAGEPIFFSDLLNDSNNKYSLSKGLNALVSENKINKFEDGIYYLPKKTLLKDFLMSSELVAKYKYISNDKEIYGYYSGLYLANKLGITSQVPSIIEIVTNRTNSSQRIVEIKNHRFYIKPSKVEINKDNVYVVQLLDLLKDIEKYDEYPTNYIRDRIKKYVHIYGIKKTDIEKYVTFFPIGIYKNFYDLRLYDVFA